MKGQTAAKSLQQQQTFIVFSNPYLSRSKTGQIVCVPSPSSDIAQKTIFACSTAKVACRPGWGADTKTLRTATLSLVYSTAEYCKINISVKQLVWPFCIYFQFSGVEEAALATGACLKNDVHRRSWQKDQMLVDNFGAVDSEDVCLCYSLRKSDLAYYPASILAT